MMKQSVNEVLTKLTQEKLELGVKICNLTDLLFSKSREEERNHINLTQLKLMQLQLTYMQSYYATLQDRIKDLAESNKTLLS